MPQDPVHVINKYGADALRLYLINSPVVRAESLRFEEVGIGCQSELLSVCQRAATCFMVSCPWLAALATIELVRP